MTKLYARTFSHKYIKICFAMYNKTPHFLTWKRCENSLVLHTNTLQLLSGVVTTKCDSPPTFKWIYTHLHDCTLQSFEKKNKIGSLFLIFFTHFLSSQFIIFLNSNLMVCSQKHYTEVNKHSYFIYLHCL